MLVLAFSLLAFRFASLLRPFQNSQKKKKKERKKKIAVSQAICYRRSKLERPLNLHFRFKAFLGEINEK
jgi:hypothetical protein